MKNFITLLFLATSLTAAAQSDSFITLKEKFRGAPEVNSVRVGGFFVRTVLWLASETDWREEIQDVRSVSVINIPQKAFRERNLKIGGFKKLLQKDDFEEAIQAKEGDEKITIYMRDGGRGDTNLYFLLVEEANEVTAIEIRGKLDLKKIIEKHLKEKRNITYN